MAKLDPSQHISSEPAGVHLMKKLILLGEAVDFVLFIVYRNNIDDLKLNLLIMTSNKEFKVSSTCSPELLLGRHV